MIALLAAGALAEPAELRSETLLELRPDGVGGIEALGGTASIGQTRLEGYGAVGRPLGFEAPFAGGLYLLAADGTAGPLRWTVGRQALLLPTWRRRLDGGTVTWDADRRTSVSAAVGLASLPGTVVGSPVGRLAGAWTRGDLRAAAGAWGETGAAHGDLEARWGRTSEVGALGAVGTRSGVTVLERGRVEVGLLPTSGVRALGWVEHREGLPGESTLSPAILSTFAPAGSDAAGLATGVTTRNLARLWASGAVHRWSPSDDAEPVTGLLGEVRWEPTCGPERWCVRPSWQGTAGYSGVSHRSGAVVSLPLPSVVELDVGAAWVPYRKAHLQWHSAAVAGLTGRVPSRRWAVEAGADLLVDGGRPTTRGWLAIQIRTGGRR